jgi:hypothetical protein
LIQRRFPNASLTVAADGWMRGELEQLARDLELRQTEFIGRVAFDDMPAMYDSADVYLTAYEPRQHAEFDYREHGRRASSGNNGCRRDSFHRHARRIVPDGPLQRP